MQLPFNNKVQFQGYCWDFLRLGIVSLDPNFDYWFADKLISPVMVNGVIRNYVYDTLEYIKIYDDAIHTERVNKPKESTLDKVFTTLDSGKYVLTAMDHRTLFNDLSLSDSNALHDCLVLGYDLSLGKSTIWIERYQRMWSQLVLIYLKNQ